MNLKDCYKILAVDSDAGKDEIKQAYRRLARKFHPDISQEPDAEQQFKKINTAYELLKNPRKRTPSSQKLIKPYSYAWFCSQINAKIHVVAKLRAQVNAHQRIKAQLNTIKRTSEMNTESPQVSATPIVNKKFWFILAGGVTFALLLLLATSFILDRFEAWQYQQQLTQAILRHEGTGITQFEQAKVNTQLEVVQPDEVKKALINYYIIHKDDKVLAQLTQFDKQVQNVLFPAEQVENTLLNYYFKQIDGFVKTDDFQTAFEWLDQLKTHYPQSTQLNAYIERLQQQKKQRLAELSQKYMSCSEQTQTPLVERIHCMLDARQKIEQVGIEHPLPQDPNLPMMYTKAVNQALTDKKYAQAKKLLMDWQQLLPEQSQKREALWQKLRDAQKVDNWVAALASKNKAKIVNTLNKLNQIDSTLRAEVLQHPQVQSSLLAYYADEIQALMKAKQGNTQDYLATTQKVDPQALEQLLADLSPQEPQSPPAPKPQETTTAPSNEVTSLLQTCNEHLQANRLTTGAGGTALNCYQQVLKQDPNNFQAHSGLKAIEDQYYSWAANALRQQQFDKVQSYLYGMEKVNPNSKRLAELKSQLQTAKRQAQSSQPSAPVRQPSKPAVSTQPKPCADCNCSDLLRQLSFGVKPLTSEQKEYFQTQCR